MNKPRMALVVLVFLAVIAIAAQTSSASGSMRGSGTLTLVDSEITEVVIVDGNTVIRGHNTWDFRGILEGRYVNTFALTIHPDGVVTLEEDGVLTGTAAGVPGTVTFEVTGKGDLSRIQGKFVSIEGTGGLENVHVTGTFAVDLGTGTGPYSARIHFDDNSGDQDDQ